jgi:hypothetical protein
VEHLDHLQRGKRRWSRRTLFRLCGASQSAAAEATSSSCDHKHKYMTRSV